MENNFHIEVDNWSHMPKQNLIWHKADKKTSKSSGKVELLIKRNILLGKNEIMIQHNFRRCQWN
ncbi:TPA: hypothetical protein GRR58_20985 [Vibrio parahaemolyticus]|nr:hypothetical protein [Vibrio parahaemolyticus]HAS6510086.1 hypothetical protein [Vibrio parahaemolyticus]HAS6516045.1 hypothetical protein [Vibrio parahaemolyticus]HAS6526035.1 hypothetical protein [Vibrio parahaemolyticus]HAS6540325.1 hypothetical protein [Vibrio parahaemolyticus]